MNLKQQLQNEIESLPESIVLEVLHFLQFLKLQQSESSTPTTLLSESALEKDWLRPEEDEAWQNL